MSISNHSVQQHADQDSKQIRDWVTIPEFCRKFTNIPEKTIKWQLNQRSKNGLHKHVQIIGKQRYISISGYAQWLNSNISESTFTKGGQR